MSAVGGKNKRGALAAATTGIDPKTTLALPQKLEHCSRTKLWKVPMKIAARVVRHGRYVAFQLAEVAVPRHLFADILRRIGRLRPKHIPA